MKRTLWLRSEIKPFEERVALTAAQAKDLLERGHRVIVEKSPLRVIPIEEYHEAGCEIVPEHSWQNEAPLEATIFGLKELEPQSFPLPHRHIHFAHVYKDQDGAADFLGRLHFAGGKLYDLEYLTDGAGKRVAAFGVWAGFTGAALGLDLWIAQKLGLNMNERGPLSSYKSSHDMVNEMKARLSDVREARPKVLIIGARGRCGRGAQDFLKSWELKPPYGVQKKPKGALTSKKS
jgi:saccharopine dehydrogenase (NAD+, L-lysine-forming)